MGRNQASPSLGDGLEAWVWRGRGENDASRVTLERRGACLDFRLLKVRLESRGVKRNEQCRAVGAET